MSDSETTDLEEEIDTVYLLQQESRKIIENFEYNMMFVWEKFCEESSMYIDINNMQAMREFYRILYNSDYYLHLKNVDNELKNNLIKLNEDSEN